MVVELTNDNLVDYFGEKKVIVVFSSTTCNACKDLVPWLHKLPDDYKVAIVDCIKNIRSVMYYPKQIKYFPTIALYLNGHFNKELTQINIIKQELE